MSNEIEKKEEKNSCGCGGGSCCGAPGKWVWIVLLVAVAVVLFARNAARKTDAEDMPAQADGTTVPGVPPAGMPEEARETGGNESLPRLVELGSESCVPCKMMKPILEELKKEHSGAFKTEFVDVGQDRESAQRYGIRVIPTQVFLDADGKELFRHEGYFGKEDIVSKWKELGVDAELKNK